MTICLLCRGSGCPECISPPARARLDRAERDARARALILEHLGGWLRAHGYDLTPDRPIDRLGWT